MWLAREAVSAKKNSLNAACIQAAVSATFFITACLLENGVQAAHVTALMGDKINLNCSSDQLSEEITMVKWSRLIRTESQDIASYSAHHRLFKFVKDDRVTISSADGTCLQIQPVNLIDEGNYTCEISALRGVFQDHLYLSIIVPPVVFLNVSFLPNGQKKFQCIASKGKPAATIVWKKNIIGDFKYILIDNDDGTVTVESQLITAINFTKEEKICIINHPGFNKKQNHTISLDFDTEDSTGLMSLPLTYTLITCGSAIALGMVMLMIWTVKKKRAAPARITDSTQLINFPVPHSGRRKKTRAVKDPIYQNTYCMKRSQHSV